MKVNVKTIEYLTHRVKAINNTVCDSLYSFSLKSLIYVCDGNICEFLDVHKFLIKLFSNSMTLRWCYSEFKNNSTVGTAFDDQCLNSTITVLS